METGAGIMPSYVIKPHRDLDQYIYWSEITDSPHMRGTRTEVVEYIDWINAGPAEERVARADESGTSAKWPNWDRPQIYSWDSEDRSVIYHQQGTVRIDDLWEFCGRLEAEESVEDLITPFEDEDFE